MIIHSETCLDIAGVWHREGTNTMQHTQRTNKQAKGVDHPHAQTPDVSVYNRTQKGRRRKQKKEGHDHGTAQTTKGGRPQRVT